jgi:hypothetical protein
VRGNLMEALDYQGGLMRGERSVAALQMARARERAMANQRSLAASARPGTVAAAQRNAALNSGMIAGDMAGREAEARLAERNAAAKVYGDLGGQIREGDNRLSMFNTDATNQRSLAQGGITKDINLGNADMSTRASIATAGNQTQASVANSQNSLQQALENARLQQDAAVRNSEANALRDYRQGTINTDISKYNAGEENMHDYRQGTLDMDWSKFNTGEANTWNKNEADRRQQNNQFNTSSGIEQLRNNDTATTNLLQQQNQLIGLQQDGTIKFQGVLAQYGLADREAEIRVKLAQMGIDANAAMQPSTWERILGMIVGPTAMVGAAAVGKP